jgi:hypothetical protein
LIHIGKAIENNVYFMPFPSGYFKDYTQNKRNDNEDKNTSSYEISD